MSDETKPIFLIDTNILVYSYDTTDEKKHQKAKELLEQCWQRKKTYAISAQNLKKSFNNTEVFQDFSIGVEREKITAIFGPNGSGKSTLLNILSGIVAKDGGEFNIENFDRFNFSYIFQNYRESLLPWRTNFENVALPLLYAKRKHTDKDVDDAIAAVGLTHRRDHLSNQLSGGQMQRVAIARALIHEPEVLLADEPTGNLDYENSWQIINLLKQINEWGTTVIMATHDRTIVDSLKKRVVTLERGLIVKDE